MRKVVYPMTVSLDGYAEDANGTINWTTPTPELHQYFNDREAENDIHLYGRRLYETMKVWDELDDNSPIPPQMKEYARIWKPKPKVVFSKTLQQVQGSNFRLVRENAIEEVRRLKNQPGKYMSVGGPGLASSLMRAGLVDEYWLHVAPIILGGGKRYFPALDQPIRLRLMEKRDFPGGVVMLRYEQERD